MKTEDLIIKEAGLKAKKINTQGIIYKNPLNGRGTQQPLFLFNGKNEIFCINDTPYCPIGGKRAFAEIIKGGLDNPAYSFKEFTLQIN